MTFATWSFTESLLDAWHIDFVRSVDFSNRTQVTSDLLNRVGDASQWLAQVQTMVRRPKQLQTCSSRCLGFHQVARACLRDLGSGWTQFFLADSLGLMTFRDLEPSLVLVSTFPQIARFVLLRRAGRACRASYRLGTHQDGETGSYHTTPHHTPTVLPDFRWLLSRFCVFV